MKLSEAQLVLLALIREVENGDTTPSEAVVRFNQLKQECPTFKSDYVLGDFQALYESVRSAYDTSTYIEPSYEPSTSY